MMAHATLDQSPALGAVKPAYMPQKPHISPALSLFAGGIAGGVEAAITYPFEFSKTRSQLRGATSTSKNPFATIVQVAREEGPRSIYAGCSTLVAGTAFKAGVRFLTFDAIKQSFVDAEGKLSSGRGVLAGLAAGCVESVLAVTPTERIKTALIDDARGQRRFNGGVQALTTMLKESGIKEVYRGVVATCIKQSATSAVRMGTYNALKNMAAERQIKDSPQTTFGIGAIAGLVTVYATQPFDTIKTRTQAASGATISQALRDVLTTTGPRGLWSGSTMRLSRLIFSGGIVFTVYEQVVSTFRGGSTTILAI